MKWQKWLPWVVFGAVVVILTAKRRPRVAPKPPDLAALEALQQPVPSFLQFRHSYDQLEQWRASSDAENWRQRYEQERRIREEQERQFLQQRTEQAAANIDRGFEQIHESTPVPAVEPRRETDHSYQFFEPENPYEAAVHQPLKQIPVPPQTEELDPIGISSAPFTAVLGFDDME